MLKGENIVDEAVMRVPPNNADAEKSVLGCMMQDREALSLAFELLTADDFYQPANREIFDAMHALNTQGMPIDLVTVDDELTREVTFTVPPQLAGERFDVGFALRREGYTNWFNGKAVPTRVVGNL